MTVRDSLLGFFKDPLATAHDFDDADRKIWLQALEWAEQSITAQGSRPLRPAQVAAWKGMANVRVSLLLGPPGTGKTFGLSWLIAAYAEARRRCGLPCRVLVSAFTRAAITNAIEEVEKRVSQFCTSPIPLVYLTREALPQLGRTIAQVREGAAFVDVVQRSEQLVCGATVWQLARLLEEESDALSGDGRTAPIFDLVCIDEASQILVAHGLMALAALKPRGRLIAAGDNKQLGPIRAVIDGERDKRGLAGSLYDFLQKARVPEFALNETFRLNQPLATFPEQRFYSGGYVAAEPDKRLQLPDGWERRLSTNWLRMALRPDIPIFIILHDGPPSGTSSPFEAHLVQQLVHGLMNALHPDSADAEAAPIAAEILRQFWEVELAVISPHRHQNTAIRELLRRKGLGEECVVETVERIQGRERDAIIASYTVGDPEFALAEAQFIFDPTRLNVTVTRAKTKLIVLVNRRLLETIPADEETFQKAQLLREFVFASEELADTTLLGPSGEEVAVALRVRRFDDLAEMPLLEPDPAPPPAKIVPPVLRAEHQRILDAIVRLSNQNEYRSVSDFQIRKDTAIKADALFPLLRDLLLAGKVLMNKRQGKHGDFWSTRIKEDGQVPFPVTADEVRGRIARVIEDVRVRSWSPPYERVRQCFAWLGPDGSDLFRPHAEGLAAGKMLVFEQTEKGETLDLAAHVAPDEEEAAVPLPAAAPILDDFHVLNALEDLDQRRINFGIFEAWTTTPDLAIALRESHTVHGWSWESVQASLQRLAEHGFVVLAPEGQARSRMAEVGRELRYVKQRFRPGDAKTRPYLVRGIKLRTRTRERPLFDKPVSEFVGSFGERLRAVAGADKALAALQAMLSARFETATPCLAGFQVRALEEILLAWFGLSQKEGFVVTAETGSGKTEAALFPVLVGAALDRLHGIRGARAMFIYPRMRLAANQAQRFAGYAQALSEIPGMPLITVGLQSGAVPSSVAYADPAEGWERTESGGALRFPLFGCPACQAAVAILPGQGAEGADRLECSRCTWRYGGWVGFKVGLRSTPPALFVSVTESLHQWQHDPKAARLFGDVVGYAAPRAVIADEIHLFTHVHGAQLGWMLRRLLARAALSKPVPGRPARPLAIGMSATLSDAIDIWTMLSGRSKPLELQPNASERVPNPRGREYFYFVQSEVESRGKDIAGASTTIQSLMCMAHGMRRRRGDQSGFRGIVFFDSIDKLKRLHSAYVDAEEVRRLPRLRTFSYDGETATSPPRNECCRDPSGCDAFYDGECWYFAATDAAQVTANGRYRSPGTLRVCRKPVYSGTSGNVDREIAKSDLVFATSSLEVGYDDPDIGLVYQHYAPVNLASFIQRKGRGGRGADDRSVTGITLTPYSPRDSWFFRRPDDLLNPAGFRIPLNPNNHFVRRGQVLTLLLDVASKLIAQGATLVPGTMSKLFFVEAQRHVDEVFGPAVLEQLGFPDVTSFWERALATVVDVNKLGDSPAAWRRGFPWVPNALFATINLPELEVVFPANREDEPERQSEDIGLVLLDCAPGNMTRRFDEKIVHWIVPFDGDGPWLSAQDYEAGRPLDLPNGVSGLLALLPDASREDIERGSLGVHEVAVRPTRLTLCGGGMMRDSEFFSSWRFDTAKRTFHSLPEQGTPQPPPAGTFGVTHDSRSMLRSATIIEPTAAPTNVRTLAGAERLTSRVEVFLGTSRGSPQTGLTLTSVVWGADVALRIERLGDPREPLRQRFVHPASGKVLLHGYRVETEGVRCAIHSETLDAFVRKFREEAAQEPLGRWLSGQLLALLVQLHGTAKGLDGFSLQRLAELLGSAYADADAWKEVKIFGTRFHADRLMAVLRRVQQTSLRYHPLLTERRLEKIRDIIADAGPLFRAIFADLEKQETLDRYYRSLVLHGLAIRLHQNFVRLGAGDERRVATYVPLPILSGSIPESARDIIAVAERGEHGDGTTRTFVERLDEAFADILRDGVPSCPSAAEDHLLRQVSRETFPRELWSQWDPRKESDVRSIFKTLGAQALVDSGTSAQHVLRTIFGHEFVGGEDFSLLDLHLEAMGVLHSVEKALQRPARTWEMISAIVANAALDASPVPRLRALLVAYESLPNEQIEDEGSRSAQDRLADQVYRLSAPLCVDGCLACLGAGAGAVQSSWTEVTSSRQTLERYIAFVRRPA